MSLKVIQVGNIFALLVNRNLALWTRWQSYRRGRICCSSPWSINWSATIENIDQSESGRHGLEGSDTDSNNNMVDSDIEGEDFIADTIFEVEKEMPSDELKGEKNTNIEDKMDLNVEEEQEIPHDEKIVLDEHVNNNIKADSEDPTYPQDWIVEEQE